MQWRYTDCGVLYILRTQSSLGPTRYNIMHVDSFCGHGLPHSFRHCNSDEHIGNIAETPLHAVRALCTKQVGAYAKIYTNISCSLLQGKFVELF